MPDVPVSITPDTLGLAVRVTMVFGLYDPSCSGAGITVISPRGTRTKNWPASKTTPQTVSLYLMIGVGVGVGSGVEVGSGIGVGTGVSVGVGLSVGVGVAVGVGTGVGVGVGLGVAVGSGVYLGKAAGGV